MHKIFKEKHEYTIITWKKAHQHPMDELAAEFVEIIFVIEKSIPKH
jgi:hypothetical protein